LPNGTECHFLFIVPRPTIAVLAAFVVAGTASAQSSSRQRAADSLFRAAQATAQAGDTAQAIKLLERATQTDEKNAHARSQQHPEGD